ncbi:hypothetical protein N8144_05830 [Planktomarina temperata]|nr:hypothetical protein [Planktomarina temperata]MDC1182810.1 hypothetical protein [Planktomarina temperata]
MDVQKHYERSSIVICLKTKSKPSALRASKSIASKLDDFWFKMRLADLDVPASHLLIKEKPKEAFTSYAPNLSEALSKYCSLNGQGRAALFFKAGKRNVGYVIDHLGDRPIDTYSSADAASFRDSLIARGLNVSSIARRVMLDLGTRPTQGPHRAFQDLFSVYFTKDSIPFFDGIIQSIAGPSP